MWSALSSLDTIGDFCAASSSWALGSFCSLVDTIGSFLSYFSP